MAKPARKKARPPAACKGCAAKNEEIAYLRDRQEELVTALATRADPSVFSHLAMAREEDEALDQAPPGAVPLESVIEAFGRVHGPSFQIDYEGVEADWRKRFPPPEERHAEAEEG
jgi:hypothetical protein